MRADKILLLLLILAIGGSLEIAWRVREQVDLGPLAWRVLGRDSHVPSFTFEKEEAREFPAGSGLKVENAFGGVTIGVGAPSEVRVGLKTVVLAREESSARSFADTVQIRIEKEDGAFKVSTNRADLEHGEEDFETHLDIRVPPGTRVAVRNEHGAVSVVDVAEADLETSYDALRLEKVAGAGTLKVSHGDITVRSVAGPLTLSSRFGNIDVQDVAGTVRLESRNGDDALREVGAVTAEIQQGELHAEVVRGALQARGEHAEISAENVKGDAWVETGFRDVRLTEIDGNAHAKSEHGEVRAEKVKGSLNAQTTYAEIVVEDVQGKAELAVEHGGVHASRLHGGAQITASGDAVVVEGFKGRLVIQARRGNVELHPDGALLDEVEASSENGAVELTVPPGSRFDLSASAEGGEVSAEVPDVDVSEQSPTLLKARIGGGGKRVTLSASHGEVRITSAESEAKPKEH